MKHLLDTHLLLWAAAEPQRLSATATQIISEPDNELFFSAVSIWEVAIKRALGRSDFTVDVRQFRRALLDNGYSELPISSLHALAVDSLPPVHRDPFDRMLVAQANTEGIQLLTSDSVLAQYGGSIRYV